MLQGTDTHAVRGRSVRRESKRRAPGRASPGSSRARVLIAIGAVLMVVVIRDGASPARASVFMPDRVPQSEGPIVLIGASYAAGWQLPAVAGSPVVNKGMEGQQSFELLERFDRDVVALRPRAVIIWGYINDVFRTPQDSLDAGLERARASFIEMIRRARAARIEVVLATEIFIGPRQGWRDRLRSWIGRLLGKEGYDAYVNRQVSLLNDWLRALAASEGVPLLDLQAVLSDADGRRLRSSSLPDGSHVSPSGYALMTAYAVPILERHFAQATDP